MRPGGGKAKGAQFEREVCKALSEWITNGKHQDVFWRSAMSGGRATVSHRKGTRLKAQEGDLSAIRREGIPFLNRFVVECKSYRDLSIKSFMQEEVTNQESALGFWRTLLKVKGKRPMLVMKESRFLDTMVVLDSGGAMDLNITDIHLAYFPLHDVRIILFSDFLDAAEFKVKRLRLRRP
jgi:hypothetical protein